MDVVGQPLAKATEQLDKLQLKYTFLITRPLNRMFTVDENCLYVIRQHLNADGIYQLVAAGKMGKEVL